MMRPTLNSSEETKYIAVKQTMIIGTVKPPEFLVISTRFLIRDSIQT